MKTLFIVLTALLLPFSAVCKKTKAYYADSLHIVNGKIAYDESFPTTGENAYQEALDFTKRLFRENLEIIIKEDKASGKISAKGVSFISSNADITTGLVKSAVASQTKVTYLVDIAITESICSVKLSEFMTQSKTMGLMVSVSGATETTKNDWSAPSPIEGLLPYSKQKYGQLANAILKDFHYEMLNVLSKYKDELSR